VLRQWNVITYDVAQLADSTPLDATSFLFALRIKNSQGKSGRGEERVCCHRPSYNEQMASIYL